MTSIQPSDWLHEHASSSAVYKYADYSNRECRIPIRLKDARAFLFQHTTDLNDFAVI